MPRLRSAVPKYRKHKASGQAVVTLAGHDHYLGPHGTAVSKAEYDRLVCQWLASGRSPVRPADQCELTVVELMAGFMRHAKQYYGTGPRSTYAKFKIVLRPLRQMFGRLQAASFGPAHYKGLRQHFIERGHCRAYVNDEMQHVARVFRWGAAEGLIPVTVPQTLAMIPGLRKGRSGVRDTKSVKPANDADVQKTLSHLPRIVAAMVRLQLLTGARPGEICALRAGDIDQAGDVWEARLEKHKTAHHGRERTIYLGPQAQDVLRPFLDRLADAYLFSPAEAVVEVRAERHAARKTPLSYGNRPGSKHTASPKRPPKLCYTTQSYGRAVSRACEKAGVPKWSPNQLRHLLATRVRREYDLDAAKTLLGHSEIDTTQIYAEKDRRRAIEVAREIG